MNRTTTMGGTATHGGNGNPLSNPATQDKVDDVAHAAHKTVDAVAGKTADQVGRLGESAHRAVDSATNAVSAAAGAVSTAADWASGIPAQAKNMQTKFTDAACSSIRARPLTTVVGALAIGYLVGRLARR